MASDSAAEIYLCDSCGLTYKDSQCYMRHVTICRSPKQPTKKKILNFPCKFCNKIFVNHRQYDIHINSKHRCNNCNFVARNNRERLRHMKVCRSQMGGRVKIAFRDLGPFKEISSFRGCVKTYRQRNRIDFSSYLHYMNSIKPFVKNILENCLDRLRNIKAQVSVWIKYKRYIREGEFEFIEQPMNSHMTILTNAEHFEEFYNGVSSKIENNIYIFETYGSGWTVDCVKGMDIRVSLFKPISVGCWMKTPDEIKNKKCTINIKNYDDCCFKWALLSVLHPAPAHLNSSKTYTYKQFESLYKFDNVKYPVDFTSISNFEETNKVAVNVFSWDDKDGFVPYRISKFNYVDSYKSADLMLVQNRYHSHFIGIKNINALLGKSRKKGKFLCYNCLYRYKSRDALMDHLTFCMNFDYSKIETPKLKKNGEVPKIQFTNFKNMAKAGYVVYADFESLVRPTKKLNSEKHSGVVESSDGVHPKLQETHRHIPCGYSYLVVRCDGKLIDFKVYRGKNCVDKFLDAMKEVHAVTKEIKRINIPMIPSARANEDFLKVKLCAICNQNLGRDRVIDHNHITGEYRGICHRACNLNLKERPLLPIFIHNFRSYDSHLIIHGFRKFGNRINVIPNNSEKYLSISVDGLVFLDSLQFLFESLDELVKNLGSDKFSLLEQVFGKNNAAKLKRKGCYPYNYMTSWNRFEERKLPKIEEFHLLTKDEHVSVEDYKYAQKIFQDFNCKNIGDYHDLYLLCDSVLLACVYENFRTMSLEYYGLDPVYYYSLPGLAFDAALKMTEVKLDQFTDVDMYEFIESGMRGGVSMVTKRKAEANNKYMQNHYQPRTNESDKFILLLDFNNLYGLSMTSCLPTGNFKFLTKDEIEDITNNFNSKVSSDTQKKGYIFEVDLDYPESLHDDHNSFPLAPERISIPCEMLSEYQATLMNNLNVHYSGKTKKLIPHLGPRKNYVVHYRNLKYYLDKGMILKKIHRVLQFDQSPWLAKYIQFNTAKRAAAKSGFEKDFFKLMNNSVFGKTMENKRRRITIHIVNKLKKAIELAAKPQYVTHDTIAKNLCTIRMARRTVKLDKAVYVGFTILDLSKLFMYKFYYDRMKILYADNCELLFTDTDSLCFEIQTDDVYTDLLPYLDEFDMSDYDKTKFSKTDSRYNLCSNKNKKVIGKLHDEANGEILTSFIGVGSKAYSIIGLNNLSKSACKGVPKFLKKRELNHQLYTKVLDEQTKFYCYFKQIRSKKHKLSTVDVVKAALHGFDSKRFILNDGIHTLSYYHYAINNYL